MSYLIVSYEERDEDDGCLYWNNADGWVPRAWATEFTADEVETLTLPLGDCEWTRA